jgi:nucleotide-binding universal stress UspA family protein
MRVLIATDGSKHATAAMTAACRILSVEDRCIDLLCVVPETRTGAHTKVQAKEGLPNKLRQRATRILEGARHALAEQGVSARPLLEQGSAIKTLLRASLNYDLTVVGAMSRNDDSPSGLGPVASRIIEHSTTSVLIGREGRNDPGLRILVPVDGSDVALDAIDKLVSLVDFSTADVTLMHVVETPWLAAPDQELFEEEQEDRTDPESQLTHEFERELEREAEGVIEEARTRLPPRTTVNRVIERGLPADAILAEADRGDYDLVLMAASGSHDMKHQLLGSVSVKVAWSAPCSVLLMRSAV